MTIYNKKYTFGVCLVSGTELWNFLGDESHKSVACYVNEVAFGPHLRMGLGLGKLSVPPSDPQGEERWAGA